MPIPRRHRRRILALLTLSIASTLFLAISAWYYVGLKFGTHGEIGVGGGLGWVTWTDPVEVGGSKGSGGLHIHRRPGKPNFFLFHLEFDRYNKIAAAPLWPIPLTLAALALTLHLRHKRCTRLGLCPMCAYDLSGLAHPVCPECAHPITPAASAPPPPLQHAAEPPPPPPSASP